MTTQGDPGCDDLAVRFLAEGEQRAEDVAGWLAGFIAEARQSLDIAVYDFRLGESLAAIVGGALRERAAAGVAIRIAYDADKPETPDLERGMDPAPAGTGAFVQSLGFPFRRIGGQKLMHQKYLVRDAGTPDARVWTGSTNLTDDSWTLQENNIVQLASPDLAAYYARDFADLWQSGTIEESGDFDTSAVALTHGGAPAHAHVLFSPGRGPAIDYDVAQRVARAQRRVRICSMLLNSSALIAALSDLLTAGRVPVSGVYDATQMASVLDQWRDVPHNRWKIGAVQDIVAGAKLVGKNSTPYSPTSQHDFMHNKVLVVDDIVITGSYNFSRSAEFNAENILVVESPALAEQYSAYVDHLMAKLGGEPSPPRPPSPNPGRGG
ncbi:MAG TPA: phosphatidylserine/phosphatidylglycerophosphate/cardiolipin synthase family protein [Thermomicrobiales bacterium]|nr:phosphatidylserine/phosphatidylglycerophosphate/cardiolipin synthase family protein [Thermomicrobiales bacterium]